MILEAKNLIKTYGNTPVLRGVNLSICEGESVAIVGRSGEGKTTLLHILGNLEDADEGQVLIKGEPLIHANATMIRRKRIGYIFQSYNLLEDFSALDNVLMPARILRKTVPKDHGIALLEKVGLVQKKDLIAKHLSGGERQRVAIARALCNQPDLIFADEPTGNLDRENADNVGAILKSLKQSIVLVTHDPKLSALCDSQYILKDGHLYRSV